MRKQWDLSTYGARIEWLLHTRRLKQADLARHLERSSGNISDVVNGKRELPWAQTGSMVQFLETNADFFLGLTEDDRPLKEMDIGEIPAGPNYLHLESEQLAELCDDQPEWLRRQLLAVARAQIDSARNVDDDDWDERWRRAVRMSGLVLGPDDADRLLAAFRKCYQLAPASKPGASTADGGNERNRKQT